jgi:hypothetical protein
MAMSENILRRDFYINVCGIPFKYIEQVSTDRVDSFMGRSDSKMAYITINADMSKSQKEATIIREWIHATLDLQGMGELSNNEQLVSVLANELYRQGFRIKCVDDNGDCCL